MKNNTIATVSQSQNKLLSETHPTLFAQASKSWSVEPIDLWGTVIQSCTVDKEEYVRVRLIAYDNLQEKERLRSVCSEKQEELEKLQQQYYALQKENDSLRYDLGMKTLECERPAMGRAIHAVNKHWDADLISRNVRNSIVKELGLGEVQR